MQRRIAAVIAALALPGVAAASTVWKSDFESGTFNDWSKQQEVASDRMQIVETPVREGSRAMKVTVHQGDDPINSHNDRAELLYMTNEPTGTEYWYRWSVLFPEDYPHHERWQLFTQWHQEGLGGSPPVEFYVAGEQMRMRVGGEGGDLWNAPLQRGQWQDFVFHVKWSPNPSEGFVELYDNGKLVVPKTFVANQFPGQTNYWKMGLYRSREIAATGTLYIDDVRMGTDKSDVMDSQPTPPAKPEQPGGSPSGEPQGAVTPSAGGSSGGGCSASGASSLGALALVAGILALWGVGSRRRPARVPVAVRSVRRRRR